MKQEKVKRIAKEVKDEGLVQKGLMNIYRNQDGSLPDISHLDVNRREKKRFLFFGILFFVALAVVAGWSAFKIINPGDDSSQKSIKLTLSGPQNISSGDEVTYTLEYKNLERVDLKNVEIIFRYPEGFEFIAAEPTPTNNFNSSWQLGNLTPGQTGKIEVKGKMIGEVGSLKTMNLTASFQPANFSSVFKEASSFNSQITSSILEINLEGPSEVLPEKKAIYKITYRNNSEQDLSKIKIIATYPTNFVFQSAEPSPYFKEGDARDLKNQWLIESLGKQQEGEIEITGGYLKDETISQASFKIQIGFLAEESEEFSLQQEKTIETNILNNTLSLNLILNGSGQNQPISFDQTLTYSLVYKNTGEKELDDVSLSVVLDSEVLDWETLEDKSQGKIEDKKITWTKDQISSLDLVRPQDEGTIDFTIKVKPSDVIGASANNLQVKSQASAIFVKIGDLEIQDFEIKSNEITNNINTDLELKVEGRYFDDDNIPVGSGPLPPVVGQPTVFRIYWAIANSLHDVSNVKVTTILPAGVDWADKYLVKAGKISYTQKERKITWTLDRLPAGKNFEDINAWFDVSVTPTKQQIRKLIILTDQTQLEATDKINNSTITKTGKAITSNLEDDPIGGGKGLVIDITE